MKNIFTYFSDKYNFLSADNNTYYGTIQDIHIIIAAANNNFTVNFNLIIPDAFNTDYIQNQFSGNKYFAGITQDRDNRKLVLKGKKWNKLQAPELDNMINIIINTALSNGASKVTACKSCGTQTQQTVLLNNNTDKLCVSCFNQLAAADQSQSSGIITYFLGFIGASAGALIGTIPYILVYYQGWIIGWLAFFISYASFMGYKLFRGPKNFHVARGMIVTVSIIAILAVNFLPILYYNWWYVVDLESLIDLYAYFLPDMFADIIFSFIIGIVGIAGIGLKIRGYTSKDIPVIIQAERYAAN